MSTAFYAIPNPRTGVPEVNALAAQRFRETRRENGLPLATPRQTQRALTAAVGPHRVFHTPLGIEILALQMPVTRQDRARERARLGKDAPAALTPITVDHGRRMTADPASVEALLDGVTDEQDMVQRVCDAFGRRVEDLRRVTSRVERYVRNKGHRLSGGGGIPRHISEMACMLSAIAQGHRLLNPTPDAAS